MKALRWILVLPVAIASFAAALFGGAVIGVYLSELGVISIPPANALDVLSAAAANFVLGAIPVWASMKTAPAYRRAVGVWLLFLLVLYHFYLYYFDGSYLSGSQPVGFLFVKDLAFLAGVWSGYRLVAGTWELRGGRAGG